MLDVHQALRAQEWEGGGSHNSRAETDKRGPEMEQQREKIKGREKREKVGMTAA